MKVVVINGSAKLERSNSLRHTHAFIEGMSTVCDVEVEEINVYKMNINKCIGCFNCWKKTPGKCVFNDDMTEAIEKMMAADVVIWSFGLYHFALPGILKMFQDRLMPTMLPMLEERVDGKGNGLRHPSRYDIADQKTVLISTCAFFTPDGYYDAVKAQFDLCTGLNKYTTLFCGQAEFYPVPYLKDRVDAHMEAVKQAGADFAQYGCVLPETQKKVDKFLMSKEEFIKTANSYYAHCIEKAEKAAAEKAASEKAE